MSSFPVKHIQTLLTKSSVHQQSADRYAQENSARVRDVELLTNLDFFPKLDFEDQMALTLRIHQELWH